MPGRERERGGERQGGEPPSPPVSFVAAAELAVEPSRPASMQAGARGAVKEETPHILVQLFRTRREGTLHASSQRERSTAQSEESVFQRSPWRVHDTMVEAWQIRHAPHPGSAA